MREQCVSYKFAGSSACQDHIKIIACDYLVNKLLDLIFVFRDLPARLFPCSRLLINLADCKC